MRLSDLAKLSLGQLMPGSSRRPTGFDHGLDMPPSTLPPETGESVESLLASFGKDEGETRQPDDSPLLSAHAPLPQGAGRSRDKLRVSLQTDFRDSLPGSTSEAAELIEGWSALGGKLSVMLRNASRLRDFVPRALDCERDLKQLLQRDADSALYLLFQLSQQPHAGYSTSHALLSAVLCELLATKLYLPVAERHSLTRAALTMNIAMTDLQDELAHQSGPLTPEQRDRVLTHPVRGRLILADTGVMDPLWLDIVASHHEDFGSGRPVHDMPAHLRLTHILRTVDRYSACLAARASRPSRSPEASAEETLNGQWQPDSVENALINTIGMYPPGTYVSLGNGEVAVVIRRGRQAHLPSVISILDASGLPLANPVVRDCARGEASVVESLSAGEVNVLLEHEDMLNMSLSPEAVKPSMQAALRPQSLQLH